MITNRRPPGNFRPYDDDEEPPRIPIWKRRGVLMLAAGGALLFAIIAVIQSGLRDDQEALKPKPGDYIGVVAPYEKAEAAPMPPPRMPPKPLPDLADKPPTPPNPSPAKDPPPAGPGPAAEKTPIDRPVMVTYAVPDAKPPPAPAAKQQEKAEPQHTGIKFDPTSIPGMKASPALDMSRMLMPGLLPCVLDTAIDSNLPGPLLCHLPGPVYSEKGALLMEASTKVIGSYESFTQNGVERLKADTAFAWTPHGVMVPLTGQPLADGLGRTGLSGELDKRYLERFGGAILLDIAKSGLSIIQSEVASGGNTYVSMNSSNSLASEILHSTINLPPIFKKNQGSMIAIWLKQPVSFADSYRLE